jgi:hypothetical protein
MRTPDLLLRLALASWPAVAVAACDNGGFEPIPTDQCTIHRNADYTIDLPAAPSMTLKVESCRLDADACTNVCLAEINKDGKFGTVTSCGVSFFSDSVSVTVAFDENQCFGEGDGGPTPVEGGPK